MAIQLPSKIVECVVDSSVGHRHFYRTNSNEWQCVCPSACGIRGAGARADSTVVTYALGEHALFCYPILYGDARDNQRKNRKHSVCKWAPLALILRASKHFVLLSFGFDITLISSFFSLGLFWVGVYVAALCVFPHFDAAAAAVIVAAFFVVFFAHFDLSYFLFYVASCSLCV